MPKFVDFNYVKNFFRGKAVALVGGAPYVLETEPGKIDAHDIVIRISNFPIDIPAVGERVDVHYSFYGNSIGPNKDMLKRKGLKLHMCKLPNARPRELEHKWFIENKKEVGIDYRYVYNLRKDFWVAPVYVPTVEEFLQTFRALGNRQPTTGFAAIYTILQCPFKSLSIFGFDFFRDKRHFTSKHQHTPQPWVLQNPGDPWRHSPDTDLATFRALVKDRKDVKLDKKLRRLITCQPIPVDTTCP